MLNHRILKLSIGEAPISTNIQLNPPLSRRLSHVKNLKLSIQCIRILNLSGMKITGKLIFIHPCQKSCFELPLLVYNFGGQWPLGTAEKCNSWNLSQYRNDNEHRQLKQQHIYEIDLIRTLESELQSCVKLTMLTLIALK